MPPLIANRKRMPNGSWRAIVQFVIVMLFGLHDHSSSRGAQTGVQIPISVDGDVVVVPVKIHGNSKVFRFVVDTGAEITIIDTPTVEILKLSPGRDIDLESDQGKATIPTVELSTLQIGSYETTAIRAASYDLTDLSTGMNSRVDGVLGIDVLSRFTFTINYGRRIMVISAADIAPQAQGVRVSLTKSDGGYVVPVTLNDGSDVDFLLDTGTNMTQLPWKTWQALTKAWQPRKFLRGVPAQGKETGRSYLARLDSLRIGTLRIDSPVVRVMLPASTGTFGEPD